VASGTTDAEREQPFLIRGGQVFHTKANPRQYRFAAGPCGPWRPPLDRQKSPGRQVSVVRLRETDPGHRSRQVSRRGSFHPCTTHWYASRRSCPPTVQWVPEGSTRARLSSALPQGSVRRRPERDPAGEKPHPACLSANAGRTTATTGTQTLQMTGPACRLL